MKKFLLFLLLSVSLNTIAQEDCKYSVQSTGDEKEYKATTDYLMHEKVFGNSSNFMFFSLANSEGVPILNFQLLSKSKEFSKIYCLDKVSKIYIQLINGKIITLIHALDEQCSGLVYDEAQKSNIRILTGSFLFTVGSLEDLEKYPISFIRIKYASEVVDYPIKKELISESTQEKYFPETYFMNNLKCIK